ncbi:MAG: DUF1289 domain-containing protein [Paracoccaceae bacterium]
MSGAVETPCIDICVIDPASRLCRGCLRSIDEIASWGAMTSDARHAVMAALPARRSRLPDGPPPMPRIKRRRAD